MATRRKRCVVSQRQLYRKVAASTLNFEEKPVVSVSPPSSVSNYILHLVNLMLFVIFLVMKLQTQYLNFRIMMKIVENDQNCSNNDLSFNNDNLRLQLKN